MTRVQRVQVLTQAHFAGKRIFDFFSQRRLQYNGRVSRTLDKSLSAGDRKTCGRPEAHRARSYLS
jgi:hypothetical protein